MLPTSLARAVPEELLGEDHIRLRSVLSLSGESTVLMRMARELGTRRSSYSLGLETAGQDMPH